MPPVEHETGGASSDRASKISVGFLALDRSVKPLVWWMRVVGAFYLLLFVMAVFVKLPLQTFAPPETLTLAANGDPVAGYLVDTWVMFGLELGVIGSALVVGSWYIDQARLLVWTVIGLELVRGIVDDLYMIARGYEPTGFLVWIVIHSVIILTGYLALRLALPADGG